MNEQFFVEVYTDVEIWSNNECRCKEAKDKLVELVEAIVEKSCYSWDIEYCCDKFLEQLKEESKK